MVFKPFKVPEIPNHITTTMVIATLVIVAGAYWDYWWHKNTGRDNFWIPPHIQIYAGLLITIVSVSITIVHNRLRINNILGLMLIAISGFLLALPFDDWWHRTYPIPEVGINAITPPHALAIVSAIILGLCITIILNKHYATNPKSQLAKDLLFLYSAGGLCAITFALILFDPYSGDFLLGTMGSITFGLLIPANLMSNEMLFKEKGLITKLATINSVLRVAATYNFGYGVMNIIPAILIDLLSRRMRNFGKMNYAMVGGFMFTSVSFLLYFFIQSLLIGTIRLEVLIFRFVLANLFGVASGILAYKTHKMALKILGS